MKFSWAKVFFSLLWQQKQNRHWMVSVGAANENDSALFDNQDFALRFIMLSHSTRVCSMPIFSRKGKLFRFPLGYFSSPEKPSPKKSLFFQREWMILASLTEHLSGIDCRLTVRFNRQSGDLSVEQKLKLVGGLWLVRNFRERFFVPNHVLPMIGHDGGAKHGCGGGGHEKCEE